MNLYYDFYLKIVVTVYYVMILEVLIKSNCIPTCFVGSHYHHQNSLYKLKHHIIKKLSHYAHTF